MIKLTVTIVSSFTELMAVLPIQDSCCGCRKRFESIYFKSRKAYRSTKSGKVLCDTCMASVKNIQSLKQTLKQIEEETGGITYEVVKEKK